MIAVRIRRANYCFILETDPNEYYDRSRSQKRNKTGAWGRIVNEAREYQQNENKGSCGRQR